MNILYVGAFRLPNLDAAAPRVLTIAKMLRDTGHKVSFISWGGNLLDGQRRDDGKYYIDDFEYNVSNELAVLHNPIKMFRQWYTRGFKSISMMEKIIDEFDAVIAYQPGYFFLRKLKTLCQKENKKLIVDLTEWYDNKDLRLIARPLNFLNMTWNLKSIKNKILISSSLNKYYNDSHNVVIPATTDASELKWKKKNTITFPEFDGITLIYAGTPTFKDKLYVAVNAVNRLITEGKNFRFYIFGVTRDQYIKQYCGDISDNINFMGRVPQDDIPGYYHQSDFMVLLRDRTRKNMMGFPTKFAEALTAGIPIITTDTSDIAQYLDNGKNGYLLEDANEESVYQLLRRIEGADSNNLINRLKYESENRKKTLDYRNFSNKMSQFIDSLI